MDDALGLEEDQRGEELAGEAADEAKAEASEIVGFDELVEVYAEELGRDAEVAAEVERLGEGNHRMFGFGVLCGC